jgi:hypothetical protein
MLQDDEVEHMRDIGESLSNKKSEHLYTKRAEKSTPPSTKLAYEKSH